MEKTPTMSRKAVVQVPAYREPDMDETLEGIVTQEVPPEWTFTVEAWVTPWTDPSCGYCTTLAAANSVEGVDVFEAPQGKLSARNAAHNHALRQGADVIVAWDADAPPLQPDTLARVLEPFSDPGVAGAYGWKKHTDDDLLASVMDVMGYVDWFIVQPFYGHLAAVTAEAWRGAGPFREDINQMDLWSMRLEEEYRFRRRVEEVGRVVPRDDAHVYGDDRRYRCWVNPVLGKSTPDYCDRRGTETFQPRQR